MPNKFLLVFLALFLTINLFAQPSSFHFPKAQVEKFNAEAYKRVSSGNTVPVYSGHYSGIISGAGQLLQLRGTLPQAGNYSSSRSRSFTSSDTLYIGDTLEVTGNWLHSGPIIIYNSGFLHFNKANATILGDIYLFGEHPGLQADSSTLYIPQAYFYQRVLFATGGAKVSYRNTTVDHSGLSHNVILVDSARLELINVVNKGFTTNGIYSHSSVYVNRINEAGEYVILDESKLEFYHSNTVLLWHQFPSGASVNFAFPDGDSTYSYHFNNSVPGISGINYSITADSCTNVMWGMMPTSGSDITISDSRIRSIGLWFIGSDTANVSGLVDNSTYSVFDVPLNDRTLRLNNCSVMTWSIYPMEQSYVNLTGCIVGEVGAGGRSTVMGKQFFCDGSGGYVWSSDSSFLLAGYSYTSGYVRSQANSILLYAYSSLSGGYPTAMQNSVIMVIQCTLPQEPRALDKGVAWYALIDQPFEANAGEMVPVTGSAWIDKTAASNMMDFGSYSLFYQNVESGIWHEIPVDSLIEKRRETLGNWNTSGLPSGQYLLKLVLTDNWENSVEALKGVMLQPSFGTEEFTGNSFRIYPNPAKDFIRVHLPESFGNIVLTVSDMAGRICLEKEFTSSKEQSEVTLQIGSLKPGCYLLSTRNSDKTYFNKVVVQ